MMNRSWVVEGAHYSTPMRKIVVCNGNEAAARSKAKKEYNFTRITECRELGKKMKEVRG